MLRPFCAFCINLCILCTFIQFVQSVLQMDERVGYACSVDEDAGLNF